MDGTLSPLRKILMASPRIVPIATADDQSYNGYNQESGAGTSASISGDTLGSRSSHGRTPRARIVH